VMAVASLVLMSVHPRSRGVAMIPPPASELGDYRAAQIALFILRASSAGAGAADQSRVIILPDKHPVEWEEAVWAMARREKPVVCSTTSNEAMLEILCQSIPDQEIAATLGWRGRSFVSAIAAQVTPRADGAQGDHLILMQDESDRSLVVSVSAVEAFFRDFDVAFGSAFHTSGSRRDLQGVVGTWNVGRPLRFESRGPGGTIVGGPR